MLLDEINSMEPALQSKLLRVLQEGYFRPVGGNNNIDVDVRIIASLNEEPEKLIEEGRLRKDFYYRLSVIRINVPSLRERKEDIPLLTLNFINHYNRLLNKNVTSIDDIALSELINYDWPGNIRELKNCIESAFNMLEDGKVISSQYIESIFLRASREKNDFKFNGNLSLENYLDEIERQIISETLIKNGKNISKTAKALKMTRQNLQYKIKKYSLM